MHGHAYAFLTQWLQSIPLAIVITSQVGTEIAVVLHVSRCTSAKTGACILGLLYRVPGLIVNRGSCVVRTYLVLIVGR